MKLLLTDGTGLTSRQVATQAAAAGHRVEVLTPTRIGLAGFTRHVHRLHRVPAFGTDPQRWLDATLSVLRAGDHDVLVVTQEQVAIVAREVDRITALGVAVAVPAFAALRCVLDKVAQAGTLRDLDLPHPPTWVARSAAELSERAAPPVYVKAPIGTASAGVWHPRNAEELRAVAARTDFGAGVVVQSPVNGPLTMIQAVFADGRLVAWHANTREREGPNGGAVSKRSIAPPHVPDHLRTLGRELGWHGALSLDAILTPAGPSYIDINPRLVEPGNAAAAGVDLLAALLAVSLDAPTGPTRGPGAPGVRTHQLLLGVLDAATRGGRRRDVVYELADAASHRNTYAHSVEELTPVHRDPIAAAPVALVAAASLIHPRLSRWFTDGAVSAYALTPAAWATLAVERPAFDASRLSPQRWVRRPAAGEADRAFSTEQNLGRRTL